MNQKNVFKKTAVALVGLSLLLCFTGCFADGKVVTSETEVRTSQETEAVETSEEETSTAEIETTAGTLPGSDTRDELLKQYKAQYQPTEVIYDLLISEQLLFVTEDSYVYLLLIPGCVQTVEIAKESVTRIDKTEITGMTVLTIVDRNGASIVLTVHPEDAAKVGS